MAVLHYTRSPATRTFTIPTSLSMQSSTSEREGEWAKFISYDELHEWRTWSWVNCGDTIARRTAASMTNSADVIVLDGANLEADYDPAGYQRKKCVGKWSSCLTPVLYAIIPY